MKSILNIISVQTWLTSIMLLAVWPLCVEAQTVFTNPEVITIPAVRYQYNAINVAPNFIDPPDKYASHGYRFGESANSSTNPAGNKKLSAFKVGTALYQLKDALAPSEVILRRNNASGVQNGALYSGNAAIPTTAQQPLGWGDRQAFYAEGTFSSTNGYQLLPDYPGTPGAGNLEEAQVLLRGYANIGTDNTFVNREYTTTVNATTDNVTANNVERVDMLWNNGILVTIGNITSSGIIIGCRTGAVTHDDAIQIAVIKSLIGGGNTGSGSIYSYGNLLTFNNSWTTKSVNGGGSVPLPGPTTIIGSMPSVVLRRRDEQALPRNVNQTLLASTQPSAVNVLAAQEVRAMFLTFADLGLSVGDTFHGYSVMSSDVAIGTSNISNRINSYLDAAIYPTDSPNNTSGADLSAINGYFVTQNISGKVWNDADGSANGTFNNINTNSEPGTNAGGLYSVLVGPDGNVLMTTPVASDGTYTFLGVPPLTEVKIFLSTTNFLAGVTGPISSTLPPSWVFTSEQSYSGLTNTFNTGTADIFNKDFGIEKVPTADMKIFDLCLLGIQPQSEVDIPLDGSYMGLSPAIFTQLTGADFEDSPTGVGFPIDLQITSLPVVIGTATSGGPLLYYDLNGNGSMDTGEAITLNQQINNYVPQKLHVVLQGLGYTGFAFMYKTIDAAGRLSNEATYSVEWCKALPVKLTSFNVKTTENMAVLTWSTTEEINADFFEIQKSSDGKNWTVVGKTEASVNSTGMVNYSFTDVYLKPGIVYYRLKMTDLDGTFTMSKMVAVSKITSSEKLVAYPNPASSHIFLLNVPFPNGSGAEMSDMNGKIVYQWAEISTHGIDITDIVPGIYVLKVIFRDGSYEYTKVVISK